MRPECKFSLPLFFSTLDREKLWDILFPLGVVPEIQCEVKRREKKAQKEKGKPNSTTSSPDSIMIDSPMIKVMFARVCLISGGFNFNSPAVGAKLEPSVLN